MAQYGCYYITSNSTWVTPVQCVPKKGVISVLCNERGELVPARTVMGWRVCMDYQNLNEDPCTAKGFVIP